MSIYYYSDKVTFATRPSSLCVDGMNNVDFCSVESLKEEIKRSEDIIDEYAGGIKTEIRTFSSAAHGKRTEFENLVRTNVGLIETKLRERQELRDTEKQKGKRHLPEVRVTDETVFTRLVYAADVFQIVFKFMSVKDLLMNVSLSCWMFRIFVINRVEMYIDLKLSSVKTFPIDRILTNYKIGGLRIKSTGTGNYYYQQSMCERKEIVRLKNLVSQSKKTLKTLDLDFNIRFSYYSYDNQRTESMDELYEEFEKSIEGCKKLRILGLPFFPKLNLEGHKLFGISFYLKDTWARNRHKECLNFFKKSESIKTLRRIDINAQSSSGTWWGHQNGDNQLTAEKKASFHVDIFNAISKAPKLKEIKFCLLQEFDYSEKFVIFLTKLEIIKMKYCEFYVPSFFEDLGKALLKTQPRKLKVLRIFMINEVLKYFENFLRLDGVTLIVNSDLDKNTAKLNKMFKNGPFETKVDKLVWKEAKITMKNIEIVCKMVSRIGIRGLEIGRIVVKVFSTINKVFKFLKDHADENGMRSIGITIVDKLFKETSTKRTFLKTLTEVVDKEETDYPNLEELVIRKTKLLPIQAGRSGHYKKLPNVGSCSSQPDYNDEGSDKVSKDFIKALKDNLSLRILDLVLKSKLQIKVDRIMRGRNDVIFDDEKNEDMGSRSRSRRKRRKK